MDGSDYNPIPAAPQERSAWRFFPLAVVLTLTVVAIVNGIMIYYAESTFPGEAITNEFALANNYAKVLDAEKAEKALGWRLAASLDGRAPVLHIVGSNGTPLANLVLRGIATRPLGPEHRTPLQFREVAPGTYHADLALSEPGNWELVVRATNPAGEINKVFHLLVP